MATIDFKYPDWMNDSDIEIVRGIPAGARLDVARIYWEAFGRKLAPSLGGRARGVAYLETQLHSDRFLCATRSGRVIGVLGFCDGGRKAVGLSVRGLAREYSAISAPWRAALMLILSRTPREGELLLDGLSIAPEERGHGIGSRLLGEAIALSAYRGLKGVRLSVVDSNPRARSLYERLGFTATETVSIGILERVYGFRRATDMVYRIPLRAAE